MNKALLFLDQSRNPILCPRNSDEYAPVAIVFGARLAVDVAHLGVENSREPIADSITCGKM